MDLNRLRHDIEWSIKYLDHLQKEHRAMTGNEWHGANTYVPYEFEFTYEEIFTIRFNYMKGSEGDKWTPPTPEEVEVVEVLLAGEPLSVDQHNTFVDWHGEDLTESCWLEFQKQKEAMI